MRLVLTGGGTGGHIYPGLTLWNYILQQDPHSEILYIGTERGLEADIVPRANISFHTVSAAGLRRQLSLQAVRTFALTYRGYRQAKKLLRDYRPDVVVGTGGYVTLPVVYAAASLKIPSVIWEANARPGLTNQLCTRKADAVAISFADSKRYFARAKQVQLTGNPRASEVLHVDRNRVDAAREQFGIDQRRRLIVFFAGSRGAETVNEVLLQMIPRFASRPDWHLLYVTGEAHFNRIGNRVGQLANVEVVPFIYDMPAVMKLADVAITRAGGASLAEVCALGVPAVLIPSPYVTANHQEENAKRLVDAGAARMVKEKDLSPEVLWGELVSLLDSPAGAILRDAALKAATPNAVVDLYQLVVRVMKR